MCHKKGHLANKCPEKKMIGKRTESKSEKPAEIIAKEICECCIPCKRVKKAPVVKRGHLPEQKVLETIAMDFFEMDGQDFLLIVDLGSRYTEAYPIKSQSSRQVIDLVTKWG